MGVGNEKAKKMNINVAILNILRIFAVQFLQQWLRKGIEYKV